MMGDKSSLGFNDITNEDYKNNVDGIKDLFNKKADTFLKNYVPPASQQQMVAENFISLHPNYRDWERRPVNNNKRGVYY